MTGPYRNGGPDAPCSKCAKRETWAHRREVATKLFRQYGEGAGFFLAIGAFTALLSWGALGCIESCEAQNAEAKARASELQSCEAECMGRGANRRAVIDGRCFCSKAGRDNGFGGNDDLHGSPFEVTP